MKFPVWALQKIRKGEHCVVAVQGWGTPIIPLEVKIIGAWGGEASYAAYFSAGHRFYEYNYKVKDSVYSDAHLGDYSSLECREVRRREKVTWEYEPLETASPAVGDVN